MPRPRLALPSALLLVAGSLALAAGPAAAAVPDGYS